MKLLCALFLSFFVSCTIGAGCHGSPSYGKQNLLPIWEKEGVEVGKYINYTSGARGILYKAGPPEDWYYICHVWGTPYDVGYAAGVLMRDGVSKMLPAVWAYMKNQIVNTLEGFDLPKWFDDLVAQFGLDEALDITFDISKKWIGQYFLDELRGMTDATGLSYEEALRIHMIGGLTQGKCSMYGAWGDAIKDVKGVNLMQLRALDWAIDGPFKNHPSITVYHNGPKTAGSVGKPFMNIGWTGWIGSITGMSADQLGISEIGVSYPGKDFGSESRIGYPFVFLLRDVLQFESTIQGGLARIGNATRTCDLLLGIGDGKKPEFRGMAVSHSVFNVYDSKDLQPRLNGSHPKIKDMVYWGMDWICPSYNKVLSQQLNKHYGNISAENTIRDVMPIVESGDLHIAIYDLTNMQLWYANARKESVTTGGAKAFDRQFSKLDANKLFAEPMPQ